MPRFEPFAALRFSSALPPSHVLAPPYDVLSDADVDQWAERSEHNIVHVDVPRGADDRYQRAAELLRHWVASGVLVRDPAPSFTIYRMRFTDETGVTRETVGVLGALAVVDPADGGVLPHERTTPKASTDRLDLTRATAANLSPVWGLSLASGLTALLAETGEPLASVTLDGVEHSVERVTDPDRLLAISTLIGTDDVLIADGHHRYGVARQYRDERSSADRTDESGGAELTLAYVAELAADQLSIEAIHRLYPDVDVAALKAALERCFDLIEAPAPDPDTLAALVSEDQLMLLTADGQYWLRPKPAVFQGVRSLDGAWLEHALAELAPDVEYQHGLAEVQQAVTSGRAVAAVLIRPTGIEEITRTAREGLLMPPKSTFFTPKLLTGFVIRET